jgi:TRAP-type uncharacterized transport system substrate-binding protein
MTPFNRREAVTLVGAAIGISTSSVRAYAQQPRLAFMTAGQGSAFLPHGRGIAKVLAVAGLDQIDVVESKDSNENLSSVDASPTVIGMAFLGSAVDALKGTGFAAGKRHENIRALFPMYEIAFITAALASQSITSMTALNGVRVGCGSLNVRLKITFGRLSKSLGRQRQLSAVRLRNRSGNCSTERSTPSGKTVLCQALRLSLSQMPPSALCSASHRSRSRP